MNKKNIKEIPIMFCFDTNYVIPAAVAFYSLLEHANKEYKYIFYVLHTDISKDQQKKLRETLVSFEDIYQLKFINMENKLEDLWNKINSKVHFTKEVLYKLLVASLFPQHDKIIVSDVDVVFLRDISDSYFSFDAKKDDYYMAGVKPIGYLKKFNTVYKDNFTEEEIELMNGNCGGYIVFNLYKIREDKLEEEFLDYIEKYADKIIYPEQDVLNIVTKGKIKYLDLNYVTCTYMWDFYANPEDLDSDDNYSKKELLDAMNNPVQLHYASTEKPWKYVDTIKSEVWFQYIVKTAFLEDYLKKLPDMLIKRPVAKKPSKVRMFLGKIKRIIFSALRRLKRKVFSVLGK